MREIRIWIKNRHLFFGKVCCRCGVPLVLLEKAYTPSGNRKTCQRRHYCPNCYDAIHFPYKAETKLENTYSPKRLQADGSPFSLFERSSLAANSAGHPERLRGGEIT